MLYILTELSCLSIKRRLRRQRAISSFICINENKYKNRDKDLILKKAIVRNVNNNRVNLL